MSTIIKPYGYYGGKNRMLDPILTLLPPAEIYLEPFMGSAVVLLNSEHHNREIINDMGENIVHLMRTIADNERSKFLKDRLQELGASREVFNWAKEHEKNGYVGLDDVERAACTYITISQSFNTNRKAYSSSKEKNMLHYYMEVENDITNTNERLQGVEILNEDGIALLDRYKDNKSAVAFVDPPYRPDLRGKGATKIYPNEMSEKDHIRLLETIKDAKCKIMLCGYRTKEGTDLYDSYLLTNDKWQCYKLADIPKACQNKEVKDIAEEFIWVNYKLPEHAKYYISMKQYSSL